MRALALGCLVLGCLASSARLAPARVLAGGSPPEPGASPPLATHATKGARAAAVEDELPSTPDDGDPALEALAVFVHKEKIKTEGDGWKLRVPEAPKLPFDEWSDYLWHLRTNVGDLTVRLMPKVAPVHATSVVHLTRLGFYDGTTFHRVITDFMAQGGCPLGNGTGYPNYRMSDEFDEAVRHDVAGRVSAANDGPGTDGCQFFVTFGPMPHLDDVHTIFGQVIDGQPTVDALNAAGSSDGKPQRELRIERATISVRPMQLPSSEDSADSALAALAKAAADFPGDKKKRWKLSVPEPPKVEFEAGREWTWHLLTDVGPLHVRLEPEKAPLQVASVIYLSKLGFYEDLDFFKVTKEQGVHAACPRSNGRTFAGYKLDQQIDESRVHERGTVSAPQVSKGQEGSQFFVALGPADRLDGRATIFGHLVDSEPTLARLEERIKGSKLTEPTVIRATTIEVR